MNDENLKPIGNGARTKSEERAIQVLGGKKSGESRRRKRDQRQLIGAMLKAMPTLDKSAIENLQRLGFQGKGEKKDQFTVEDIGAAALLQKVMRGDTRAYRLMLEILGEDARSMSEAERLAQETAIMEKAVDSEAGDGLINALQASAGDVFEDGMDEPKNISD